MSDDALCELRPRKSSWIREVIRPGVTAVRELWKPFLLIQLLGLAFVVSYFHFAEVRDVCDRVAWFKLRWSYLFSAALMSFCGGVCPEIFKFVTGVDRSITARRGRDVLFGMVLFSLSGMWVDGFYRLLAIVFGNTRDPLMIAAKVASDQFIYSPIFGTGIIAVGYALRRDRYKVLNLLRKVNGRWYMETIAPLLPPCWAYWIPMTTLMYSLPTNLTFVYGACGSAASATLLVAVASRHERHDLPEPIIAAAAG